jgi:hypothetical protein
MCAKIVTFAIAALFASLASGQPPAEPSLDRVLHFTHAETVQSFQEMATVIRSTTDIRQLSVDGERKTLALRGTAAQAELADWLFHELDRPASGQPPAQHSATREYRMPGNRDDVVRVFYPAHAETVQNLQEMATVIRAIADILRLFTFSAPRAIALRGTSGQLALAEWLFDELDKPADGQPAAPGPAPYNYRPPDGNEDTVRVFYLPQTATVQGVQEIATRIRKAAEIRRIFSYNPRRALALRGTAAQIALAEQMVRELN